ncbi:aldehyde dehydrogenase [Patulibacter sp. NPDC049589]|uniref:aldehyde dehydrogenase n=1 Tax=Patulibacter sp. NPDC049589 TaxID=3154731 RepID=UPI00342AE970
MSTLPEQAVEYRTFYIGGEWVQPAGAGQITVTSPVNEEVVGITPDGVDADVDRAVVAARSAYDQQGGWASWTPEERGEVLERFAVEMDARAADSAVRTTMSNGMPFALSQQLEGGLPGAFVRYYVGLATAQQREEIRPGFLGGPALLRRYPIGVVAAIVPWNFPQALTFAKIAPLLAVGCTVVLKPSPETVLDAYTVAEAADAAGVPAGVINVVPGGRETGAYLVRHPGVDKVAFTGSTAAGRSIGEACGRLLRPVTLELGGKSAAIVLDDADLASNLEALFGACLINNGQTCWLNSRILAPRGRHDEVVELLASLASGATIGDPFDEATQVGPLVSARQRDRVEGYIAQGIEGGARVATGGGRPDGLDRGFYVEPTVFANVSPDAVIAREEIFGPVLSVIPYDGVDDAVRLANDSEYGLGGTVWTTDHEKGLAVARRIQTGAIGINQFFTDPSAPFGGVKSSGLGREMGVEALSTFQELQTVYLDPAGPVPEV